MTHATVPFLCLAAFHFWSNTKRTTSDTGGGGGVASSAPLPTGGGPGRLDGGRPWRSEMDKWGRHYWGHHNLNSFWQRDFLCTPITLFLSSQKRKGVPFPQSVKINYFCSGPIFCWPHLSATKACAAARGARSRRRPWGSEYGQSRTYPAKSTKIIQKQPTSSFPLFNFFIVYVFICLSVLVVLAAKTYMGGIASFQQQTFFVKSNSEVSVVEMIIRHPYDK